MGDRLPELRSSQPKRRRPVKLNPKVIAELTEQGFHAEAVDHYNSYTGRTHDLFGIFDVLAVGQGKTIGVQVTSRKNAASRRKKILASPVFPLVCAAGWEIQLWLYDQPNGPGTHWRSKVEHLGDFHSYDPTTITSDAAPLTFTYGSERRNEK